MGAQRPLLMSSFRLRGECHSYRRFRKCSHSDMKIEKEGDDIKGKLDQGENREQRGENQW